MNKKDTETTKLSPLASIDLLDGGIRKTRSDEPCLHCSYAGTQKYKLCDDCFRLWCQENNITEDSSFVVIPK